MPSVDKQKTEAVRLRMVGLLGQNVEMRVSSDLSAVEYRLEGQTIRVAWERFQDHERPDQVFPTEALHYAQRGESFLLTADGEIIPD